MSCSTAAIRSVSGGTVLLCPTPHLPRKVVPSPAVIAQADRLMIQPMQHGERGYRCLVDPSALGGRDIR